jgi:ATP-binding cassette, subfamily F, member 3
MTKTTTKVKNIVIACVGGSETVLDDTVLDYISGLLQDDSFDLGGDDLSELVDSLSPFLFDASLCESDEDATRICKNIVDKMKEIGIIKQTNKKGLKVLSAPVTIAVNSMDNDIAAATAWMKPEERISTVNKDQLNATESRYQGRRDKLQQREERKKLRTDAALAALKALKDQKAIVQRDSNAVYNRDILFLEDCCFFFLFLHCS